MTERRVEVVTPHQADHASTQPDALRITGGAVDGLCRFHEFVCLALAFLGCIARSLPGSVVLCPTLGDRSPNPDKQG